MWLVGVISACGHKIIGSVLPSCKEIYPFTKDNLLFKLPFHVPFTIVVTV